MVPCPNCGHRPPVPFKTFWTDPGSGEYSSSRFVFFVLNIFFLPVLVTLAILYDRISFEQVVKLVLGMNAAPTLVYGFNSAFRALKGSSEQDELEVPPAG